jgi:hypothetical protein
MRLSGNPTALLLLRCHYLAGEIVKFFLGLFLFGNIPRRGAEP